MHRRLTVLSSLGVAALLVAAACGSPTPERSRAFPITSRSQLVGGARALGEVGDVRLENERIRVVLQAPGFSRGFGVYGGSLIDADFRRPSEEGSSAGGVGSDQFGELFPAFFVQACAVDALRILDDGSQGGPARVEASGTAGDFLELASLLNRAVTGSNADWRNGNSTPRLRYSTVYELAPGARWVTLRFTVENIADEAMGFPSDDAKALLGVLGLPTENFTVPTGDVALFGATNKVFIPGVGFDLRFGLQDAYARKVDFPGFPGIVGEFIASRAEGTSYGFVAEASDANFVWNKREAYAASGAPIDKTSLLFPFVASGFVGIFENQAPKKLAPGEKVTFTRHFIVGSGDVQSVVDGVHELRKTKIGRFGGQLFDTTTSAPIVGARVLVYQNLPNGERRVFSEVDTRNGGQFQGTLPPGSYALRPVDHGRWPGGFTDITVRENETTAVQLSLLGPGRIIVRILDDRGMPLPAKASAIGTYPKELSGELPRSFLFDLQAGESFRHTDFVADDPNDPATRRYIEETSFTQDGVAELSVRPGTYDVYASRGPYYSVDHRSISVKPGRTETLSFMLKRTVPGNGWFSGDTHIHSRNSIDSRLDLDTRVRSLAAEGIDWAVATDHNYVTDYRPHVERTRLAEWIHPVVGIEMTTLESGHFNGFPLRYAIGPVTHGAFEWARQTPDFIFDRLRSMGSLGPNDTIVQVNHARDGVLGYFAQYGRSTRDMSELVPSAFGQFTQPTGPAFRTPTGESTFSDKFDAMELANGKLVWEIHHHRVPQVVPADAPSGTPAPGRVLVDGNGEVTFPGAVEDWFQLLNQGKRPVGTGAGDSHDGEEEPGQFRTLVFLGDERPSTIRDQAIVDALRAHRAVVTNGPMIDFRVDDATTSSIGADVRAKGPSVTLRLRVTTADWQNVRRLNVWRNGLLVATRTIDAGRNLATDPYQEDVSVELARDATGTAIDSWFVVEGIGDKSLFPVVAPAEVPPVLLTEAIASLAGPLGLSGSSAGSLEPPKTFAVFPFAITNPVWVRVGDGPFRAPGVQPFAAIDDAKNEPGIPYDVVPRPEYAKPASARTQTRRTDAIDYRRVVPLFYPRSQNPYDIRKVLSRIGHAGGHVE
jgi:hypothetical protein